MRKEFKLPDVGEGISEAEIVEYLVKEGDEVRADQPAVRVETDKAVVELPCPYSGKVVEISHEPGDTVEVGQILLIVDTEGEAAKEAPKERKPGEREKEKAKGEKEKKAVEEEKEKEKRKPAAEREEVAAKEREEAPREIAPERVLATPHTRKVARELGVDISQVQATRAHRVDRLSS